MSQLKEIAAIKKELVALEKEARKLARVLGENNIERLEGAGMKLWNTTKDWEKRAQDSIKDVYENARKQGKRQIEVGRKGIGKHPLGSVGSALLAGLLIGAVIGLLLGRES
jgi:ElaB/YqjD/DUF883 family membrane-anchored ribosome-binding protein